jgi:CheY-like chemotaxis protein/HPt (histidine-containing phosphotransfer) domain-containing protein
LHRILVADDHATNRKVLLRQLNALGYAADSCANGIEALSLLADGRYQLLISDCQMPEMDGYTLAQAIRAREQREGSAALPIVAFTANAFASDAARALAAGMDDYLSKPTTMKALADMLARYLPAPAPLDESVLAAIIGEDRAARAELLADFHAGCRQDAAALRQAWNACDTPGLIVAAHRIAGAGRMVGACRLADAATAFESAARSGAVTAPASYAWLESELTSLRHYLTSAYEH